MKNKNKKNINRIKSIFFIVPLFIFSLFLGLIAVIRRNLLNIIKKVGKNRINRWMLLFSISLFCVGIFEFFYIWFFRYQISGYSRFVWNYGFRDFVVQFMQVYSVLFIPLLSYVGFKYRNSIKFNSKKIKIIINLLLIFIFSLFIYFYHAYAVWEWVFLFMPIFILISSKFNCIFALSFSYLSFYGANMLFEMQGLTFLKSLGTSLSYILVFGILAFILYNLKIKINYKIILSFIPVIFLWILYFPIWQSENFNKIYPPHDLYVRLFTFPFYIIIALTIYFNQRKYGVLSH